MYKILIFFLIILFGISFAYMHLPKFGSLPDIISNKKIMKSPNFKNGSFQNQNPIPLMASKKSMYQAWSDFLFKTYPNTKPTHPIPSVKTNIKDIDKNKNILIWLGHSSYYIQIYGIKFLIDPIFSSHASPLPFMIKSFDGTNSYSVADFPEIDYLIITHDHWDHLDYQTLKDMKPRIKQVITTLGVGSHLRLWGFDNSKITEMDWYDEKQIIEGSVICLPARHFSGRTLKRNKTLWGSFLLNLNGFKIYIDGDSGYDKHYEKAGRRFGKIDLALLEAGQYNIDWKYIHKNPKEVIQAAKNLKARNIITGHNSKFNLAKHQWNEPLEEIHKMAISEPFNHLTPKIGEIYRDLIF